MMAIEAGTKLGRYEIRSKIGAGGMGDVYLAQDTELDRTVALKICLTNVAADGNACTGSFRKRGLQLLGGRSAV